MSNKVIQTILRLKDEMSDKLKIVAKATEQANKQLEQAKKQIDKHKAASVKNTEALNKSKAQLSDLKKVQSMYRVEIAKAEQQVQHLTNQTSKNKKQQKENSMALDAARQSLESLRKAQNQTSESIKYTKEQVDNHKKALEESNKKVVEAREEAKKYSKQVMEINKNVKKSKETVKKWGKSMVSSLDAAIKRAAKFGMTLSLATAGAAGTIGIGEAVNLEGYKTQLETAVSGARKAGREVEDAGRLMSNAIKLANDTPFETGQVVEATAIMEAYGVSSNKWLKDVADMAGATNKDILQATEAMADGTMGEFERLKEFGILKEDLIAKATAKYGRYAVFSKSGQVKDRLKLETILQETMQEKFKGGAEKQAKTMKGLWSTITGVTKTSLAQILGITEQGTIKQGSLYELLKQKMQLVVNLLSKWQKDGTIQRIGEQVTQIVLAIISLVSKLYNFFMKYKNIILLVMKVAGTLYFLVKVITLVITVVNVFTTVLTVLKTVWMILNVVMGLSPLGLIVLGVMAIVAAGFLLMKVLQGIWKLASKAFGVIKKVLGFGKNKINVESKTKDEKSIENKISTDIGVPDLDKVEMESSMGMPKVELPKQVNTQFKDPLGNNQSSAREVVKENKTPQFIFNFKGDIYGMEDFREKVAEAVVKSYSVYKANIV